MRVIVTGSRDGVPWERVRDALSALPKGTVIVQGGARGVDQQAITAAIERGDLKTESHAADWDKHGKAAGPIRNQEMVDAGADLVLAFPGPGSVGTWDLVRRADAAGIRVHVHG